MKYIKQVVVFILVIFLLCSNTFEAAYSDLIYEPDNSFYARHSDECQYQPSRTYIVNSEKGFTVLYRSPTKNKLREIKNDEKIGICYTYEAKDGSIWGLCDNGNISGWVTLSDLLIEYDYISFFEEYYTEMEECDESLIKNCDVDSIIAWTYPNSGVQIDKIRDFDDSLCITQKYTDENDRLWGYIPYWHGYRNAWVCLSEPQYESLKGEDKLPIKTNTLPPSKVYDNNNIIITLVILTAIVVIASSICIWVGWKRKNDRKHN